MHSTVLKYGIPRFFFHSHYEIWQFFLFFLKSGLIFWRNQIQTASIVLIVIKAYIAEIAGPVILYRWKLMHEKCENKVIAKKPTLQYLYFHLLYTKQQINNQTLSNK